MRTLALIIAILFLCLGLALAKKGAHKVRGTRAKRGVPLQTSKRGRGGGLSRKSRSRKSKVRDIHAVTRREPRHYEVRTPTSTGQTGRASHIVRDAAAITAECCEPAGAHAL
jgi:hypothetical protein